MTVQNLYADYTEVDVAGDRLSIISGEPNKVTITSHTQTEACYLYKDFGVDFFSDIEFLFTFLSGNVGITYRSGGVGQTNNFSSVINNSASKIGMFWYNRNFRIYAGGANQSDIVTAPLQSNTPYYCRFRRSGTTIYGYVYSDSARTALLGSGSRACDDISFRYMTAYLYYGITSTFNGYVTDIEFVEEGGFNPAWAMYSNQLLGVA